MKMRRETEMAREVNTTQSYSDKAVKLVPTEIVGAYMVLAGIIGIDATSGAAPTDSLSKILIQIVFFVLLVLTPLYLWKMSGVSNVVQLIVTTLAFIIWIYTLGGPFAVWGIYEPKIAALILTLWSLVIPIVVRPTSG
jgi:hypothetical protein